MASIRQILWDYPYTVFIGEGSYAGRLLTFYKSTRPFSYVFTTVAVSIIIAALLITQVQSVLGFNQDQFIEGAIVGVNAAGDPQGPANLNPLQIIKPQLDKDIIELVYEPLIKVKQNNAIEPVLAENYNSSEDKAVRKYRFSLRKDVKWHDGTAFTSQDVKATFDLIKFFGENDFSGIYASNAAKNMSLEVLDDYVCEFTITEEVIPNIYELLTFKILPSHKIQQYKDAIEKQTGIERLTTVGTGPFILSEIRADSVILNANTNYHAGKPKLSKFTFKLFRDEDEAAGALRAGQIHGISNITNDIVKRSSDIPNLVVRNSNIIFTQYWGMYFDLSANGRKELKDKNVRRALSYAINREVAVQSVFDKAEPTYGTIPRISSYYAADAQQPKFNRQEALKLLEANGWKLQKKRDTVTKQEYTVRAKGDQELRFNLQFANNPDRFGLVATLVSDLEAIGVIVEPRPLSPQNLLKPGEPFELTLLGMNTFVDPDRYELFHSSQAATKADSSTGGLNISSYVAEKTVRRIVDRPDGKGSQVVSVPIVDDYLDNGRKVTAVGERRTNYTNFQKILAEDVPVIFLYHPSIRYLLNKRIRNVGLTDIRSLEDRLTDVENWEISYN